MNTHTACGYGEPAEQPNDELGEHWKLEFIYQTAASIWNISATGGIHIHTPINQY